jgi:hypothetical protein
MFKMRNYLLAIALLATTLSYSQNFRGLGGVEYSNGEWSLSWLEYKMDSGTYIAYLILDKAEVKRLYRDVNRFNKTNKLIGFRRTGYSIENFTDAVAIYNSKRESIIVPKGMQLGLLKQNIKRSIAVW